METRRFTRRTFLGAAALGLTPIPRILLGAAERVEAAPGEKVLVVLQLSGGNDGLNTVIPFEDPLYHKSRPTLAVPKGLALPLKVGDGATSAAGGAKGGATGGVAGGPGAADIGLHPAMKALHALYREGAVAVVQGVGYPNPSRSHFRSMDIWHTARPDVEDVTSGWLGNAVSRNRGRLGALDIGDERLPLALAGDVQVPTLQSLDWLDYLATDRGRDLRRRLRSLNSLARAGDTERVRALAASTLEDLDRIIELRGKPSSVEYPSSRLADSLRWAGQLIGGGFSSRIYYVSQGGFDTHAQQRDAHAFLLGQVSDAVVAFYRHLKSLGAAERVALMIFSEFGRRVRENGSLGTDHGVAAPVFVVSGSARGGLHSPHPSLDDLEDGDLKFSTDFRRVYATLLEETLGIEPEPILGGRFEKMGLLEKVRRV